MRKLVANGRTVEEAVISGLVRLGVSRSEATIRVLQEPVRGFLGLIGSRDAQVEVSVVDAPENVARDFLSKTLRLMGVEGWVHSSRQDGDDKVILMDVECRDENFSTVIGRHGVTLDALQYLTAVVVNRETEGFIKVYLDAGGYRQRRAEGLQRMAERAAKKAIRTGRSVSLDVMSAADRRIVHLFLQEDPGVSTVSEGAEPHRKVVVVPVGGSEKSMGTGGGPQS